MQLQAGKSIGTPGLIFITLAGIASPMGMVIMAKYGMGALFYYAIIILLFFIPSGWVCSELASGWPQEGGMYHWITVAFGRKTGNVALWLQWLSALISFPVILTFAAGFLAYGFNPNWMQHGTYIFVVCLVLSFLAMSFPMLGVRPAVWMSAIATICSTLIPTVLIIIFAIVWLLNGHPSQTQFDVHQIIPKFTGFGMFSLLGATVFMFAGMELAAYCIKYCKDPKRQYAKALWIAGIIVVLLCVAGTLAISVFVNHNQEDVVVGMMQAFDVFLVYYHLHWFIFVIIILGVVGWMGVLGTYMFTMSYGLLAAAKDHMLPKIFEKHNKHDAPINLILLQGIVTIVLATLYVFIPNVNSAYWMIEAVVAIAGGLRYVLMFAAAIRLRYSHPNVSRSIRVGKKGNGLMLLVSGLALLTCLFAVVMTFVPPNQFNIGNTFRYIATLVVGTLICIWLPILVGIYSEWKFAKESKRRYYKTHV